MKNLKIIAASFLALLLPLATSSATLSSNQNLLPEYSKDVDHRFKRQSNSTSTTTTARPKKNRPANIFGLISVLVSETRNDTSRALNEIGNLFNAQFSQNTPRPIKNQHTVSSTTAETAFEDEDGEVTTTTEPYRISRQEFFGLLRSNVQGLRLLFQKELGNALRDTTRNARQFGKEFRSAFDSYSS